MDFAEQVNLLSRFECKLDVHAMRRDWFFRKRRVVIGYLWVVDWGNSWNLVWSTRGCLLDGMRYCLFSADFNKATGRCMLYSDTYDGFAIKMSVRGKVVPVQTLDHAREIVLVIKEAVNLAYDEHRSNICLVPAMV